jgi:hypothetical protein
LAALPLYYEAATKKGWQHYSLLEAEVVSLPDHSPDLAHQENTPAGKPGWGDIRKTAKVDVGTRRVKHTQLQVMLSQPSFIFFLPLQGES